MKQVFDVIVIGGGATGLGVAVEAITRGYSTLLLEAYDYGKGTSSKSTKLVHGGIRYLANFDFALVKEGLEERYYFLNNAPHLAKKQSYLIPFHNLFERFKYSVGIALYDAFAKDKKIGKSQFLSHDQLLSQAPQINPAGMSGGAIYYDGVFDDTRMLVTLLRTFEAQGGMVLNYHPVTDFLYQNNKISGVKAFDSLQGRVLEFTAKTVINATGTLTDVLLNKAEPQQAHQTVSAAQGTHLVFDKAIFDSPHCLVIPETSDGRILFVLPWHDKIIVGTTDVAVDQPSIEPIAQSAEIDFILETLNRYTKAPVTKAQVKSVFCGQRPLVRDPTQKSTKKISRRHEILETDNGLISIVGGKWTIYRRMGEDTINYAVRKNYLPASQSVTRDFKLFGHTASIDQSHLAVYGSQAEKILAIQKQTGNFDKIHPDLPYLQAEIIYQVREEQAKTVEDVLARRTRAVLLDAKAAKQAAPLVAKLMATELGHDEAWVAQQVESFERFVRAYIIN